MGIKYLYFNMLFFIVVSCDTYKSESSYVRKAKLYEDAGNYSSSLIQLNEAIKKYPNKSYLYVLRGRVYSFLKNELLAMGDFSRAFLLDSNNTSAYYYKGISLSAQEKDDSAILYYNYSINTKKAGDFYFEKKQNNILGEEYNDISIKEIRYQRAISFYAIKNDSLALTDFFFSLENRNNVPSCNFYIGVILISKGDVKGCNYLKNALEGGEEKAKKYFDEFCIPDVNRMLNK